ncbi:hypothetical protein EDC94DRAFT_587735 [Helicostylum pulchrum]|nr:hypothetical protein EDC94DRAFT_587735 [Helicostylum pulchrum]
MVQHYCLLYIWRLWKTENFVDVRRLRGDYCTDISKLPLGILSRHPTRNETLGILKTTSVSKKTTYSEYWKEVLIRQTLQAETGALYTEHQKQAGTYLLNRGSSSSENYEEVFSSVSLKSDPKGLSDLRLLSLNYIYLFSLDTKQSITAYFSNQIQDLLVEPVVPITDRCVLWSSKVPQIRLWHQIQKVTIPILCEAMNNMDEALTN